jgi:hypothetical protein
MISKVMTIINIGDKMIEISLGHPIRIRKKEERIMSEKWSRKKLFVMYLLWMPIIAVAFAYYTILPAGSTVGLVAENIAAVALFGILYSYMRSVLERKREATTKRPAGYIEVKAQRK